MLAYLDSLCVALTERNDIEVRRLLSLPLARHLPRRVRDEALALTRGGTRQAARTPIQAMQFRHQMAQLLLGDAATTVPPDAGQLELALPMVPDTFEGNATLARAARGGRGRTRRAS